MKGRTVTSSRAVITGMVPHIGWLAFLMKNGWARNFMMTMGRRGLL